MFIEFEAQSKPQLITYDLSLQQVTLCNWTFFFPSSFSFYTRQSAPIPRYPSIIRTANKRSATIVPRVISQRHGHEWLVVGTEAVFIASDRCTNNAVTLHNWSRGRWKPRGFSSSRVKTAPLPSLSFRRDENEKLIYWFDVPIIITIIISSFDK